MTASKTVPSITSDTMITDNEQETTAAESARVSIEGDENEATPVRKAAIIENQQILGGHPEGSAPALDRLIEDETQDDELARDQGRDR